MVRRCTKSDWPNGGEARVPPARCNVQLSRKRSEIPRTPLPQKKQTVTSQLNYGLLRLQLSDQSAKASICNDHPGVPQNSIFRVFVGFVAVRHSLNVANSAQCVKPLFGPEWPLSKYFVSQFRTPTPATPKETCKETAKQLGHPRILQLWGGGHLPLSSCFYQDVCCPR